jgi:hypothetical protein
MSKTDHRVSPEVTFRDFAEGKEIRLCICGCGSRVYGRKQYAREACRKKAERERAKEDVERL